MPARLPLANLPTPLIRYPALDTLIGAQMWVKRDDMTAGAETGNKIRKLEYLIADARRKAATTLITCGGLQSNHARATALLAVRYGLRCVLLLRHDAPHLPPQPTGNLFLSQLAGADIELVDAEGYRSRDDLMADIARRCARQGQEPYVIPEGGSNGLGALGYHAAMGELMQQLADDDELATGFDLIATACGSAGTAAGLQLGASQYGGADQIWAFAVCDDQQYFEQRIKEIIADARIWAQVPPSPLALAESLVPCRVLDAYRGPGYGLTTQPQLQFMQEVTRRTGLVLDPVYSGKALYGLAQEPSKPQRICFLHTGGCPGLLAAPHALQ